MATSSCATPIKGTHLRIVALDVCGNPVTGSSSLVVVTKGFVQVQMSPDYEDGTEFFERTADGTPCVNQKDDPTLKRYELTIDFCEVNVLGVAFIASARALTLGTPATGTGFAVAEGNATNRFSLEVWQQVAGAGACDPSGQQRFIYNAFPNVGAARFGDYTIENDRSTLVTETMAFYIHAMPPQKRAVVIFCYFLGLRQSDVAQVLGVSESRVSHLHLSVMGDIYTRLEELLSEPRE